jgi:hypothetical protein
MRLLVIPGYEYPYINADSSYTLMRSFISNAVKADPNLHVYWVLPTQTPRRKMYRWKFDDEWGHPQVTKLFVHVIKGRDLNEMLFGEELFELINPLNGEFPFWDAAITNNAGKAAHLARMVETMPRPRPPIYVWDYNPKLLQHSDTNLDMGIQAFYDNYVGAYANPDVFTEFCSTWCMKQTIQTAKTFLSSSAINQVRENSSVFRGVVDLAKLQGVMAKNGGKKFPKTTLYFGGRFTGPKRGELIAEIYDYAFRLGKDVDIIITTPTANNAKVSMAQKQASEIKVYEGLTQTEAWEIMLQCHVGVCATKHFAYVPSAVLEQIYAGLVVMVYDNCVDTALGEERYPYLFKDKEHAVAMLKKIIDDMPAAQKTMAEAPVQTYIREKCDLAAAAPLLVNKMRGEIERRRKALMGKKITKRDMWGELAQEVTQLQDRGWDKVFEYSASKIATLEATKEMPLLPGIRRTFWQLYVNLAIRLGDDCSQSKPAFGDKLLVPVGQAIGAEDSGEASDE